MVSNLLHLWLIFIAVMVSDVVSITFMVDYYIYG